VLLHVLRHVERDERRLVAEQELGERLRELVLPTPVGPRKMKEPLGRFGSLSPARVRRTDWLTALMASSWPMIRLWSSPSMLRSFAVSSSVSL
jgi:hypothetical protein